MAVLCEAISVVVRVDSVERYCLGGSQRFAELVPNSTFCTDGELFRVGFMVPDDVHDFIEQLRRHGLQFDDNASEDVRRPPQRPESDIMVVDQIAGPTTFCNWLECGRIQISESAEVTVALLATPRPTGVAAAAGSADPEQNSPRYELHVPTGWTYENSLYARGSFVDDDDLPRRLKFLREDDRFDIYLDSDTGREVFIARTS